MVIPGLSPLPPTEPLVRPPVATPPEFWRSPHAAIEFGEVAVENGSQKGVAVADNGVLTAEAGGEALGVGHGSVAFQVIVVAVVVTRGVHETNVGHDLETKHVCEVESHVTIEGVGLDVKVVATAIGVSTKFVYSVIRLAALVDDLELGLDNSQLSCVQDTQPVGFYIRTFIGRSQMVQNAL